MNVRHILFLCYKQGADEAGVQPSFWQCVPHIPQPVILHSPPEPLCWCVHAFYHGPAELPPQLHILPEKVCITTWSQLLSPRSPHKENIVKKTGDVC